MPHAIDLSRHPLVLITFVGRSTDDEFDEYLREMQESVLERRQKNVTVIDASRSEFTSPTQRKKQADWLRANEDLLRRYSLGTAFVIDSAIVRGMLTAILWIAPMPVEHTVVATRAAAEAWSTQRLATVGLRVGSAL